MLVAVIGTLWVVSFIGALAFTTVAYDLIVTPDDDEYRPAYVLTGRRLLTTLFLSLATFYAGLSRNVDKLPPLVEYRLTIQPVSVWPAYVWLIIAVAFLGMAAISELIGMDWRRSFDFSGIQAALYSRRQTSPAALATAIPNQPHPSVDYLQPRQIQLEERPFRRLRLGQWRSRLHLGHLNWGRLNSVATAAAVLLVAVVSLFLLNRIGFFGAIGRVAANYSINTILPGDRSTPTPTPIHGAGWAVLADGDESTETRPLALASGAGSADEAASVAQPQSTATPAATLPAASTPMPTPTLTPEALITVNNAAGVNARRLPNLSAEVVQVLLPGTSAAVISEEGEGDWIPVRLSEGSEAWVFADVVALSRPLAGSVAGAIDPPASAALQETTEEEAVQEPEVVVSSSQPSVVNIQTDSNAQAQPVFDQPAADASRTEASTTTSAEPAQAVRSSSFSGAIVLLEPASGTTASGQVAFRWQAPTVGADRAYEVVLWRDGESPLADGASLGSPTQSGEMVVDLSQRGLIPGTFQWGVLLVQTNPYRRLAHLSNGQAIEVAGR